jgi:pathogenesis-related protein 1
MRRLAALALIAIATGCGLGHDIGTLNPGSGSGGGGSSGGGASGSAGAGGQSGGMHNPLTQDQINAFVDAHNAARSGLLTPPPSPALPPVAWDSILADSVYNYAIECQGAMGLLSHNANRSTDYQALGGSGYVGENIYGSSGSGATAGDAVTLWMKEASSYDYASNSGNAGHYTQVVWRDSVRIGCAIVDCPALTYHNTVICDYAPGGNISGQKPY